MTTPTPWRIHFQSRLDRDGWTVAQLARQSGITAATLYNWLRPEADRGEPPIGDAIKLAHAMGVTLDALFRGGDDVDQIAAIVREAVAKMRGEAQARARAHKKAPAPGAAEPPDPAA